MSRSARRRRGLVAVLGAGLQGACIALELARRGFAVDLVDQDPLPLNRASVRNEGKIHLGFVYANDLTRDTARSMLRGALTFRRLLSGWTDGAFDRVPTSAPFHYLVPNDSLLSPDELADHYAAVGALCRDEAARGEVDYLGVKPDRLWRRLQAGEYRSFAAADRLQAGFATVEVSIGVRRTAEILRRTLAAHPAIRLRLGHRVWEVRRIASRFLVEGTLLDGTRWCFESDQVVNVLWDGRLAIDRLLGLDPPRPWVHRLKFRLIVTLPARLRGMPSLTFTLGAYGDVVVHADGHAYVSWYPECLRGWSSDLDPPRDWAAACTGALPRAVQAPIGRDTLRAFDGLVPGLAGARILTVDAGVIFAWGRTDITDPESEFHARTNTGVLSVDGYHSVNTGKLTTAPLFALDAADAVCRHADIGQPARDPRGALVSWDVARS